MEFSDIYTQVMTRCHHAVTETALLALVKTWINSRYQEAWAYLKKHDLIDAREEYTVATVAEYDTGTVETNGTTTITGTDTVFTSGMVGRKFKVTGWNEIYTISAFVSTTEITLNKAYNGDDNDEASYKIYDDEVSLPSDCSEVIAVRQDINSKVLDRIGLKDLRALQVQSPVPISDIDSQKWALSESGKIILYPPPSRSILLKIDYIKKITELSDSTDEPMLPVEFHNILVRGAMADLYDYDDDPRAQKKEAEFYNMLATLARKNALDTDMITFKPVVYRS